MEQFFYPQIMVLLFVLFICIFSASIIAAVFWMFRDRMFWDKKPHESEELDGY